MINYDEFSKIELRVAKILEAEKVEGSEKLIKMQLDAGDKDESGSPLKRQILSGIAKNYTPEELIGREIIIVANLEPRKLMGLESNGMLLASSDEQGTAVLCPDREVPPGGAIK